MFWYVLMCFAGTSGVHCQKVEAPSHEACVNVLPLLRNYAYQMKLPVEVDCIDSRQYT